MELTIKGECPYRNTEDGYGEKVPINIGSFNCDICEDHIGNEIHPYRVYCKKDLENKCKELNLSMSYISDGVKCSESDKEINKWNCSSCDSYEYGIADKYILCKKQDIEKCCNNCKNSCTNTKVTCPVVDDCNVGHSQWQPLEEVEKTCKTCGFSKHNNSEAIGCDDYRKSLSCYGDYCINKGRWKSIDDVQKMAKEFKTCERCGFSRHNNPTGDGCAKYRKDIFGHEDTDCDGIKSWKSIKDVQKMAESLKEKSCDTCGYSKLNNGCNIDCIDYRNKYFSKVEDCYGLDKWISTNEFKEQSVLIEEVEKLKKDKIKLDKDAEIEYNSDTECVLSMEKLRYDLLGVGPERAAIAGAIMRESKNLRNQLLEKENKTMANQNETVKDMQVRKMTGAAKTALRVKAGQTLTDTVKKALGKAFPGIPLDNPIASGCIALLTSFAIDNTRFADNAKAQFAVQGMFDSAAIDGVEATGVIKIIEGVIEKTLAQIDFKEAVETTEK